MKGYDTADYAGTRLIETIILYNSRPVKVGLCTQKGKDIAIQAVDMESGELVIDTLDKFDLNPPPLGYVNLEKTCMYMTRMPMRKDWKQGLRKNNMTSSTGQMPDISMKAVSLTIMGKFPSIGHVMAKLSKYNAQGLYKAGQAFHRDFAVMADGRIWYKSIFAIGVMDLKTGSITVDPAYEWTREALMEVVGEIA